MFVIMAASSNPDIVSYSLASPGCCSMWCSCTTWWVRIDVDCLGFILLFGPFSSSSSSSSHWPRTDEHAQKPPRVRNGLGRQWRSLSIISFVKQHELNNLDGYYNNYINFQYSIFYEKLLLDEMELDDIDVSSTRLLKRRRFYSEVAVLNERTGPPAEKRPKEREREREREQLIRRYLSFRRRDD
jgi:hypothetical protein